MSKNRGSGIFSSSSENITSAWRALRQNWLRTSLTMSGIVVGVISIVTLIAILKGVKTEITNQVSDLGANLVIVVPSKLEEDGPPFNPMAMMGISSLTDEDVSTLKALPGVAEISPVLIISGLVELTGGKSTSAAVVGTNRQGVVMNPTPMEHGRYFFDHEKSVCVLGYTPSMKLFGTTNAVGKVVRVQDHDWTVVGVMAKPKGNGSAGGSFLGLGNLVYLPDGYARILIPGVQVNRIVLRTGYKYPAKTMLSSMKNAIMKNHHGHEDFGLITQEKGLDLVVKLVNMAQSLLVLIAAISLFVAGVGIMNIMLVTVTERTREIGIRKTVGARRSDIFQQFITEAVILSLIGGMIGLAISKIVCVLITKFSPLTPEITPSLIVMALLVCTIVGVFFGVTPAIRASALNPIDALRHD